MQRFFNFTSPARRSSRRMHRAKMSLEPLLLLLGAHKLSAAALHSFWLSNAEINHAAERALTRF
jgi:hypothetical protein